MVNKKKRLFKLLFFPISLLLCMCIFLVNSFASPGYSVENNGNVKSLNLFSYFSSWSNGSTTDSRNYFDLRVSFNDQSYTAVSVSFNSTGFKSVSFTTPSSLNNMLIKHNGSSRDIDILYTTDLSLLQTNTTYTFSFNLNGYNPSVNNGLSFNNIMLNAGSSALDYFPYGYYYSGNVYSNYSIYSIFNGVNVSLWDDYGGGPLAIDTLSLNENDIEIDYHDIPNIVNYFQSHTSSNLDYYLQFDFQNSPTSASLSVELNSYNIANYCEVVVNNGRNSKRYSQNVNSNVVIVNTFNDTYSILDIGLFTPIYSSYGSFRLTLISADTSNYNYGYSNGYNDGLADGENIGFNSGYQSGYNTGATTNIETNGIRTLFNSILSFPVDMIKSVFNFEFMGVNIASVIMFIVSIGIVAFVLKKFL